MDDIDDDLNEQLSSRQSSVSSLTKSKNIQNEDIHLGNSIREYGKKMVEFAKIRASKSRNDREYAREQAKRKRIEDLDAGINKLKAEKRGLLIQAAAVEPGSNAAIEEAYKLSMQEIDNQITKKENEKEDIMNTPIKSNCTPPS